MAARVNTRFVTILSLVLIGLTAALGLTYALVRPSPESRMAQARILEEQGRHAEALLQYERALARERDNFDYLVEYADSLERFRTSDAYDAQQALSKFLTALTRASDLRPDDDAIWRRAAEFRYVLALKIGNVGSWNALYDLADSRLTKRPDSIVALRYRGIAQSARMRMADLNPEQRQQGKNDLERVVAADPHDAEATFRLAMWYVSEAINVQAGARDMTLADNLRNQGVAVSAKFLADHPDRLDAQINHGRILVSIERLDEAQALLAAVEAQLLENPSHPDDVLMVSRLLSVTDRERIALAAEDGYTTRGQKRSTALLQRAVRAWPDDLALRIALGSAYQAEARLDEAIDSFDHVRRQELKLTPMEVYTTRATQDTATYQYANLLLTRAGRTTEQAPKDQDLTMAREVIRGLPDRLADHARTKALQGKMALVEGKYHDALRLLNEASNQLGDRDIEVLLLAASASQQINQFGESARRLEQVLQLNPDLHQQRLSLARLYLRTGQVDQAQRQINLLRQARPTDAAPLQLQAAVYLSQGEPQRAVAIFEAMNPDENRAVALRLAGLYAVADRKADAMTLLRRLTEEDPRDMQALQMMLSTAEDQDEREAALERAKEAGVDQQVLRVLSARYGDEGTMNSVFDELLADMQQEDPFQWRMTQYRMLAQQGQLDEARRHLDEAARLKPDNPSVIEALFNEAIREGDLNRARALADKARRLNLDQAEGQFFMGKLLLLSGDSAGAVTAFRRGLTLRPVYSEGWQMLGGALQANGDSEAASAAFVRALDQRPDNVTALRGLARAQAERGETTAAIATLERAVRLRPNDLELRSLHLSFIEAFGKPADALQPRQQMAAEHPEYYSNRRALARLLVILDRPAEGVAAIDRVIAEEGLTRENVMAAAAIRAHAGYALQARDMLAKYVADRGPDVAWDDWSLLGTFLLQINAIQDAQQAFQRAIELEDPKEKQATRQLADALFRLGQDRQAAALYEQVVRGKPDDERARLRMVEALVRAGDVDRAQQELDEHVKLYGSSVTTQLLQGAMLIPRATSALMSGDMNKARSLQEQALEAFNRAIEQQPRNAVAFYQRAMLLRTDPQRDAQVISDLRQALSLDADMAQARRLLAQIHISRNELGDAERELRSLIERAPDGAEHYAALADLLLSSQRYAPLRRLLDDAATRFPTDPTWPQWKARLAAAQGRVDEQLTLLRQAFDLSPHPALLADVANAMLSADRPRDAMNLLNAQEPMVARQPVLLAIRARAMAKLDRSSEAADALRQAVQMSQDLTQLEAVTDQMVLALGLQPSLELLTPLSTGPRAPAVELMIGRMEILLGRHDAAVARLEQAQQRIPPDSPLQLLALRMTATAQLNAGRHQAAADVLRKIIDRVPNDVEALNNLAFILADNLNRGSEALAFAERAAAMAPRNAQVLDTLGWTQYKAGRPTQALETLRRSARLQAGIYPEMHMGIILAELGQAAVARNHLESARTLAEESNNQQLLAAIDAHLQALAGGVR